MPTHCAKLLINVEEEPKPQSSGNSNLVLRAIPSAKKLGDNRFKVFKITESCFITFEEPSLEDRQLSFKSKTQSIQSLPSTVKLCHLMVPSVVCSTRKNCPLFVGTARAFTPSSTAYSAVNKSLP